MSGPYILRRVDHGGEHRATIIGGNHEPLMAITEGINEQSDVETALLRSLEALLTDDQIAPDARLELVTDYLGRSDLHGAAPD